MAKKKFDLTPFIKMGFATLDPKGLRNKPHVNFKPMEEKKVLWLEMKKYINQINEKEDQLLLRKDLLEHLKDFNSEQSIDKLRCYLTNAGFLQKSVKSGIYYAVKPIPLELTQTKLIEIAYPID